MKNIRPDIQEVIGKTQEFYNTTKSGSALIKIRGIGGLKKLDEINLTQYPFPNGVESYLDECAKRKLLHWQQRPNIKDDQIPSLTAWFGIAEHSSFLGGNVDFTERTSWQHPCIDNLEDLSRISMSEDNSTYKMVIGGIGYIKERYGDIFAPMARGTSGGLEIANALRGNDFFYDFYEDEASLCKLLDYCTDALIWYYNKQLDAVGDFLGGTVTGFGEWLRGRSIGQLSEDTTTMLSLDLYNQFGKPRTEHICNVYENAFMHTHALSEHCLESISNIKGVKLMEISSDPNTDRAIEVYKRNKEKLSSIIPVLSLTREEIIENMNVLKEQKTIIWYDAASLEDAVDMTAFIRKELPII